MSKPRVFIGSTVESLDVANTIQENLEYDAHVTVWNQGVFDLSSTTIESLEKAASKFDFAVFVFTPDDIVTIRNETGGAVRDNVLFEFGLFVGGIGRSRTYIFVPKISKDESLHIPTDLLGLTTKQYSYPDDLEDLPAALGPGCNQVRRSLKKMGRLARVADFGDAPVTRSTYNKAVKERNEQESLYLTARQDVLKLEKLVEELKRLKNADEAATVVADNSDDSEAFAQLVERASDALSEVPSPAREAIFYHIRTEEWRPGNTADWDDIRAAEEEGFVHYREDSETVTPNRSHRRVQAAIDALEELDNWVSYDSSEEWSIAYDSTHDLSANIRLRPFWDEHF